MENRSEGGWAIAAACALAIVLLLVVGGGVGVYYLRQQMALAIQTERAAASEAEARLQAERARAEAETAVAALQAASQASSSTDADDDTIRPKVDAILRAQEEAWNRGDLGEFMKHYWQSESLTFSSEGQTTRGWTETLQHYRKRYPTREAMGHLTLSELQITPLGDSAALVLGKWNLQRDGEPLSGNFSLVVRRFDNHWLIVHDHTSRTKE